MELTHAEMVLLTKVCDIQIKSLSDIYITQFKDLQKRESSIVDFNLTEDEFYKTVEGSIKLLGELKTNPLLIHGVSVFDSMGLLIAINLCSDQFNNVEQPTLKSLSDKIFDVVTDMLLESGELDMINMFSLNRLN